MMMGYIYIGDAGLLLRKSAIGYRAIYFVKMPPFTVMIHTLLTISSRYWQRKGERSIYAIVCCERSDNIT